MIKWLHDKLLNLAQKLINKAYEKNGLTDEILDLQVELNMQRNKSDNPDKNNIITDDGFVQ